MDIMPFRDFDSRFSNVSLGVINAELKLNKEEKKILNVFQRKLQKPNMDVC